MFTSREVRALKRRRKKRRENRFRRPWRLFGQACCARTKPNLPLMIMRPRARRAKQVEAAAHRHCAETLHLHIPPVALMCKNVSQI